MKISLRVLVLIIFALNSICSFAQVVDPIDKNNLANGGYDVVAYFTDNAAKKGKMEYSIQYKGAKYQFATQEHRDLFKNSPEKFLPVCDGYCAWGVAEKGKKVPVNPQTYKIIDGRLHLFFNGDFNGSKLNTLEEWNKDENKLLSELPVKWARIKSKK